MTACAIYTKANSTIPWSRTTETCLVRLAREFSAFMIVSAYGNNELWVGALLLPALSMRQPCVYVDSPF